MSAVLIPTPPLQIGREREAAESFLRQQPEVEAFALIGSAMYLPSEQVGDVDFAVLVKPGQDYLPLITRLVLEGWEPCGEQYESMTGAWGSVRREWVNLMVTHDRQWYSDYLLAMEVCKVLRLTDKDDRIAVCRVVRDKLPADNVRPHVESFL